jgi:hypothetical protein
MWKCNNYKNSVFSVVLEICCDIEKKLCVPMAPDSYRDGIAIKKCNQKI